MIYTKSLRFYNNSLLSLKIEFYEINYNQELRKIWILNKSRILRIHNYMKKNLKKNIDYFLRLVIKLLDFHGDRLFIEIYLGNFN